MTVLPSCISDNFHSRKEVVDLLVGDHDDSIYSRVISHLNSSQSSLAPSPSVDSIFTSLVQLLHRGPHSAVSIILGQNHLIARAKTIADAANQAEHLLEVHYASCIIHSPPSRVNNLNVLPLSVTSERRVFHLSKAAQPFPYVENYVRLVRSECHVISACLKNNLRSIAVVGSGPMPLTGVLMSAQLGVRVTLVDVDETATKLASSLVALWEGCGALQYGFVQTLCSDARHVNFTRNSRINSGIEADAVIIASLVPDEVKVSLVRNIANGDWDGIVGVRSAHGLISVANYEKANRCQLNEFMDFIGYVVPVGCVENGKVVGESEEPLALFPNDVLNSLELYTKRTENKRAAQKIGAEVRGHCDFRILEGDTLLPHNS